MLKHGILPAKIELPPSPRIRYTRKSSEGEDRQATSHEQQYEVMNRFWGPLPIPDLWWRDSHTGTTFDRPDYQAMAMFCQAHPQSLDDPGWIEIYDPSRFGRPLTAQGREDIMRFLREVEFFTDLGWRIRFTNVTLTGEPFADALTMVTHAYMAAAFSAKLARDVRRGKRHWAEGGGWIHGTAPFPAKRFDSEAGRVLERGELARPGVGGTILVAPEEDVRHWIDGAQMLMDGHSLDSVGDEWHRRGLQGPFGGKWGHKQVRNSLTNRALIGLIDYSYRDPETGQEGALVIPAKWEPLVPIELFDAVQRELEARSESPSHRARKRREVYPLKEVVRCAACGATYTGARLAKAQGSGRCYQHPALNERMDPERYRRSVAAGCRRWTILAEELETTIKDLIVAQRASSEYESEMRALLLERSGTRTRAEVQARKAEDKLGELKREQREIVRLQMEAARRGLDPGLYFDELDGIQKRIAFAEREHKEAERFAESATEGWSRMEAIINETRNLTAIWHTLSLEERGRIFDQWVDSVLIAIEPIPGMKRANRKFGIIYLESAPGVPEAVLFGEEAPSASSNASEISSRTHSSSSASSFDHSASRACGPPMRPSAQAACPRTSGSSSSSASESTGTASSEPQFPNATATFRRSPRRLARLTGEPLNLRENSSCESPISSTSLAPCTPCRGQNADSSVSCTNRLLLNGHTSWQMSQP